MGRVLVVGAGPVGLTLAFELKKRGVAVRIIDQNDGPSDLTLSKALAIHCRTAEILEDMGIAEKITSRSHKVTTMTMFDKNGQPMVSIPFDEALADTHFPYLQVLRQGATEQILMESLNELGVHVERNIKFTSIVGQDEDGVDCMIGDATERYDFVVGCDGSHSIVRKQINTSFTGEAYDEHFFLADCQVEWDIPCSTGFACLSDDFTLFSFPLDDQGNTRLVINELHKSEAKSETATQHGYDKTSKVTVEEVASFVHRFRSNAHLKNLTWATRFNISHRVADQFQQGRVFLAGDAAHIHSPAGGQGMNTGIQDAHNLAWKIALVQLENAKFDILNTFQLERRLIALDVVDKTHKMTRVVSATNSAMKFLRNFVIGFAGQFKIIQHEIAHNMSELQVSYKPTEATNKLIQNPKSFLSSPKVSAGTRTVDVAFTDGTSLYSRYRQANRPFVLVVVSSQNSQEVYTMATEISRKFPRVYVLQVSSEKIQVEEGSRVEIVNDEGEWQKTYGDVDGAYIVRPDNYLGYSAWSIDESSIVDYLAGIYQ